MIGFGTLNLDSIHINQSQFKLYKNIIVHYTGDDTSAFYDKLSSVLTDAIIHFYENRLLKRVLEYNYFYFGASEKKQILSIARDFIEEDFISRDDNYLSVYSSILNYIVENKSIVLDGFVNFRLSNYMKNLDYIVDIAVNKYITDKEYNEFVNMLKLYISLTPCKSSLVHLVYLGSETILLDKDKNIIHLEDENLTANYLSDITFSSNDYALNSLLNLTPRRIIIHLLNRKV